MVTNLFNVQRYFQQLAFLGNLQPLEEFELPSPYTPQTCGKQVGGYPYMHLFHTYIRI